MSRARAGCRLTDGAPGDHSMTLDVPENVAAKILDLCLPGYTETSTLYNCRGKKLLNWTPPG